MSVHFCPPGDRISGPTPPFAEAFLLVPVEFPHSTAVALQVDVAHAR